MDECEIIKLQSACEHYKSKSIRLKKALERINNSITRDGNSINMSISIFELKGIVETAIEDGTAT